MRWAANDRIPLRVDGTGLLDCHLYRQDEAGASRLILHLVNLSHPGAWRAPLHELMDAGPFEVAVRLSAAMPNAVARCLVAEQVLPVRVDGDWARFEVASITDHEVVVIETDERQARLDELQS